MTRMKALKTKSSTEKGRCLAWVKVWEVQMGGHGHGWMAGKDPASFGRSTFVELKRNCAKNT